MPLTKRELIRSSLKHGLIAIGIGIMFGFLGPFGTYPALALPSRYGFWIGLILFGYLCVQLAWIPTRVVPYFAARPQPVRLIAVAIASAVPMLFATAWALVQVQPGRVVGAMDLPGLFVAVASVQLMLSFAALHILVPQTPEPRPAATRGGSHRPAFMLRVPLHLGTDLVAIEAQDHYLRIHTRLGADLILCRFADALNELTEADGLQVHRSWWVAADAVQAMARDGARTFVTLANGVRVPVSRSFRAAVRAREWPVVAPSAARHTRIGPASLLR